MEPILPVVNLLAGAGVQRLYCSAQLEVFWLGLTDYETTWSAMKAQVQQRLAGASPVPDQLWLLHHSPVYTLGTRGVRTGLIGDIQAPIVKTDRGGDVTYHGPGQLIGYPLVQLDRLGLTGATFVHALEELLIDLLALWGIRSALADPQRPGVYVDGQKIASLGLRCKRRGLRQVSYHGFALNVDMDLAPFLQINPCGYAGQAMTQVKTLLSQSQSQQADQFLESRLALNAPAEQWVRAVAEDFAQCFGLWHARLFSAES